MANPVEARDPVRSFIQLWAESLSLVLGQIAASAFPFSSSDAGREEPGAGDLHLTVTIAGAVRGELSLQIPEASALALAKIFLSETEGGERQLTDDDRSAVEELFRQVAGHVVTSARPTLADLSLTVALGEPPTWSPAASGWISSDTGALKQVEVQWRLSAALNAALLAVSQKRVSESPSSKPEKAPPQDNGRLEFFMDLELEVTLRLGGRDILLKDVLELGPGSVLELDREIHDPADLLLDGRLIAQGEVVMVNGNYGMRVTEVFNHPQSGA